MNLRMGGSYCWFESMPFGSAAAVAWLGLGGVYRLHIGGGGGLGPVRAGRPSATAKSIIPIKILGQIMPQNRPRPQPQFSALSIVVGHAQSRGFYLGEGKSSVFHGCVVLGRVTALPAVASGACIH